MRFLVEIPVKISKIGGKGIKSPKFLKIEVDQENEARALQIVAGRIQHLLTLERDLSWD